jgi:transposase InsO family protein
VGSNPEIPKAKAAKALALPKASLYYQATRPKQDETVASQIRELHDTYDDTLGHRKLAILLRMNKKRVLRVMKAHKIKARRRKKHYVYGSRSDTRHTNLVKDLIKEDKVGTDIGAAAQIVFSDIFEFRLADSSKVRGCFVLNYRDRQVLSLVFDYGMRAELVTAALDRTEFIKQAEHHYIFHSDQGSQYGAAETLQSLLANQLTPSMSRAGTPTDNPYAERFVGTFKHAVVRRTRYYTIGQFLDAAELWINFYNERRPHESLKYLSPKQYATSQGLPTVPYISVGMV